MDSVTHAGLFFTGVAAAAVLTGFPEWVYAISLVATIALVSRDLYRARDVVLGERT